MLIIVDTVILEKWYLKLCIEAPDIKKLLLILNEQRQAFKLWEFLENSSLVGALKCICKL